MVKGGFDLRLFPTFWNRTCIPQIKHLMPTYYETIINIDLIARL